MELSRVVFLSFYSIQLWIVHQDLSVSKIVDIYPTNLIISIFGIFFSRRTHVVLIQRFFKDEFVCRQAAILTKDASNDQQNI
ncbi:hypothetical protein [uncultured Nostoc sp.]|uniref:hypothetical protein n=1 Tax=uncultured Nostoc sp. TaxID=340711 RepID=UPI0035CC53C6